MCRAPALIDAESHPSNVVISNIVKSCFPEEYASRKWQSDQIRASWAKRIPIFLSPVPTFPHQPLTLALSEPRYQTMLDRIMQDSRQFGVVSTQQLRRGDFGVIVTINHCEKKGDTAHIQCSGTERFRVEDCWVEDGTQGLNVARIETVTDEAPVFGPPANVHPTSVDDVKRMTREDENAYGRHVSELCHELRVILADCTNRVPQLQELENHFGSMPGGRSHDKLRMMNPTDVYRFSFWMCSILPIPAAPKRQLLGSLSLLKRLKGVKKCMQRLQADIIAKAEARAARHAAAAAAAGAENI
jgi:ATP-dependent protease La (LON) substrate-binding domain